MMRRHEPDEGLEHPDVVASNVFISNTQLDTNDGAGSEVDEDEIRDEVRDEFPAEGPSPLVLRFHSRRRPSRFEALRHRGFSHKDGEPPKRISSEYSRYSSRYLLQQALCKSGRAFLTDEDVNKMIEEFAKQDEALEKTWSRKLVESFLQNFQWYYPNKGKSGGPSLEKAWAYYEHVTLPRQIVGEQTTEYVHRRAEPGDVGETELYSPFRTPRDAFIEWGIGVDLYFTTLRYLSWIFLIAGLMNIPNLIFYSSSSYSGRSGVALALQASAVCTRNEWVVCTDCNEQDYSTKTLRDMFATFGDTVLVQRSACQGAQLEQGLVNWFSLLFMIGTITFLGFYLGAREVRFDEDKVTCSDYTVVVKNPPPDAYDPDVWMDFFSQFAEKQVTAVTVTVNNDLLLRKLLLRRVLRGKLHRMFPEVDIDDEDAVRCAIAAKDDDADAPRSCFSKLMSCTIMPILHIFGLFLPGEAILEKILAVTEEIKELQLRKYEVTRVYATFETEEGQRAALAALTVGRLDILMNNTSNVSPDAVCGDRVLDIRAPPEPSAVRWLDLSTGTVTKNILLLSNLAVTIGLIGLAGVVVERARISVGPELSGPLVTVFNVVVPLILRLLMIVERHASEGDFQASLYLKITLFRWMNTAVLTKIITPFRQTLGATSLDLLPTVNAILRSELLIAPFIALLDIPSNFRKHVLAPRARTQEEMNVNFHGTPYNMGERYTSMTKVLFLCFFYSSLQPLTFFYGAAILTVQYYVDKFLLMRIWSWAPAIGPELAVFSRRYFFSGSLLAFAIVSSYTYAQWPFDNTCSPDNPETGVAGFYPEAQTLSGNTINITVTQNETSVYCSQTWKSMQGLGFPAVPAIQPAGARWMTNSQETLTRIYGWTSLVVLIVFLVTLFGSSAYSYLISLFRGVYQPEGESQHIDLSNITDLVGYVPQVSRAGFPFPMIACNIDGVDASLLGWEDPDHNYDYHNLIFDVPYPGLHREKMSDRAAFGQPPAVSPKNAQPAKKDGQAPIYAVMKHYPPAWLQQAMSS